MPRPSVFSESPYYTILLPILYFIDWAIGEIGLWFGIDKEKIIDIPALTLQKYIALE
jgi:hypothetical protein